MQDSDEIQITFHHAVFVPPPQKELTCTILGNFLNSLCPEENTQETPTLPETNHRP